MRYALSRCEQTDNGDGTITFTGPCIVTGKIHRVTCNIADVHRYERGGILIQDCFPSLPAEEREFLINGMSPAGWAATFRT